MTKSSIDKFIKEVLVSILVTRKEGNERFIIFQDEGVALGEHEEEVTLLYVSPSDFIEMVVKCIRDDKKYSVGFLGVKGYAAEWIDVTEESFIERIIASATGIICWHFNEVSNAKITVKQKPKPKSKKSSSQDNVIPFRPTPKGRKGRKGKR